jgi:hypothetical protein
VPTTDHRSVPVAAPADPRKPVAQVLPGSVGPHLVPSGAGWTVTWASPTERGYQVHTTAVDAHGIAAPDQEVVHLDSRVSDLVVSPQSDRHVLALFMGSDSKAARLDVVELGGQGELLARPRLVRTAPSPIVWADAPPLADSLGRQVVFWAERAGAGVDLYQSVQRDGQSGAAVQLARDAVAWQVVSLGGRLAVATLSSGGPGKSVVAVRLVDASTQASPQPLTVATLKSGGLDLDMVPSGGQLLLGWSEGVGAASRLMLAAVDLATERVQLSPATPPRGEQTLLRLVAQGSEVHAMWQELGHAAKSQRSVWYGKTEVPWSSPFAVSVGGHFIVDGADAVLPMFGVSSVGGPWVLGHGQLVGTSKESTPQSETGYFLAQPGEAGKWSARRIEDLVDHEPLVQVWDLTCRGGTQPEPACAGLAADGGSPTHVYLFDSKGEVPNHQAPQISITDGVAHMISRQRMATAPEPSALCSTTIGERKLVSYLSYFDPNVPYTLPSKPAPDGKLQPVRALLNTWSLRDAPDDFALPLDQATISLRAHSWGGVDLASDGKQALLAWAAMDQGDPQVFATLLDARGQKVQQKMLTKTPGDVFDVTVAHGPSGYLLGFIDTTTGNDEIYVMRVDGRLGASAPLKVTDGALHPTGLVSQMVGDQLVLAWAENREEDPAQGANIYVAVVDDRAEKLVVMDHVVLDDGAYLHSPQLGLSTKNATSAPRLVLSYLVDQQAPLAGQEELSVGDTRLRWTSLKVSGRLEEGTFDELVGQELPLSHVGAFSLDCTQSCRLAVVAKGPWSAELWLAALREGAAAVSPISPVYVPTPQLATPVLRNNEVYFAESVAGSDQFQLVRLRVAWHAE